MGGVAGEPGAGAPAVAPVIGLAASQLRRVRRIVDAAVRLAEEGGFEGMRLRDVAEAASVSLGTLYKYFRSKEDVLLFALNEDVGRGEAAMVSNPVTGSSPLDRVTTFFALATADLVRRPLLARAVLRSSAAGDPVLTVQVAALHLRMTRLIVAALRGEPPDLSNALSAEVGSSREHQIAFVLLNVWYASLSGWAGGLHPVTTVSQQIRIAASLLLGET